MHKIQKNSVLSALFLVAGTCVGGGMLALPVATGISGFFPSLVMMAICWIAMTATALLLLEVSLWMEEGVHLISMVSRILGTPGKIVSWCLYLFICYASLVAYAAGGGVQVAHGLNEYFSIVITKDWGAILFCLFFGGVLYLGSHLIGRVNAILFTALVVAYFALVGSGIDEIKPELLLNRKWSGVYMAVPLLLTSFSFQTMVPSLTPYLKSHARSLRFAIIGGTTLVFVIYAIWQTLILGIVPAEGPHSLSAAMMAGEPATQFLREHVEGRWVYLLAEYFAFFAIITSFLGIGLGLFDFLSDGLKIKKAGIGNLFLGLLIIVPTLIFSTQYERAFLVALETSGGFGDSILNGLIPVLMVWVGRYHMNLGNQHSCQLPGGRFTLSIIFIFFAITLALEVMVQTGQLSSFYDPFEVPIHNIQEVEQ